MSPLQPTWTRLVQLPTYSAIEVSIAEVSAVQVLKVATPSLGAVHLNQTSGDADVQSKLVLGHDKSTGMPALALAVSVLNAVGVFSCSVTALVH